MWDKLYRYVICFILWQFQVYLAAWNLKGGGTAMYALMALAGDLGCSSGPTVVGMIADANGGNLKVGLGVAMIFPLLLSKSLK